MVPMWFITVLFAHSFLWWNEFASSFPTEGDLLIELASGFNEMSGRVEVGYNYNPVRFPICADNFGMHAARVVCRFLGFNGKPQIAKVGYFGRKGQRQWLTGLSCKGTEAKLEDCPNGKFTSNCRSREDAGVFCTKPGVPIVDQPEDWTLPDPMVCGVDMSQAVIEQPTFIELNDITSVSSDLLTPRTKVPQEVKEKARIANPQVVDSTARFPWIAQVRYATGEQSSSMYICGATIISEFFVLTSARCASRSLLEQGLVRVGDFDVNTIDLHQRDYKIENTSTSVKGNAEENIGDHDIALIKIKADENGKGIGFSQFVLPACLPTSYTPYLKSMICTIGGYGRDEFFRESKFLRTGAIPLLARDKCRVSEGSHSYLSKGLFCAGGMTWSSTGCSGDRGSPLICKINGRSTLMGVDSISGCGTPSKISYYADVQDHLPWIANTIKSLS